MDIKVLRKISGLCGVINKNNQTFKDGISKLEIAYEELKSLDIELAKKLGKRKRPKNLLRKYEALVGYSESVLKQILPFLKENNIEIEQFNDFLTETSIAFMTVLHHLNIKQDSVSTENEGLEDDISSYFNPDNFRKINTISKYSKDLIPNEKTTIFENIKMDLNLNSISNLAKELSCLHEIEVKELGAIIPGKKPIEVFSREYIDSANKVFDKSPFKNQKKSFTDWNEVESSYMPPGAKEAPNQEFWDQKKEAIKSREAERKFNLTRDPNNKNRFRPIDKTVVQPKLADMPQNVDPSHIPLLRTDNQPIRDKFGGVDKDATSKRDKSLETPFLLSW